MQTMKGVGAGLVALITCPCHLPLTLPLLLTLTGGTAVGFWLAANPLGPGLTKLAHPPKILRRKTTQAGLARSNVGSRRGDVALTPALLG